MFKEATVEKFYENDEKVIISTMIENELRGQGYDPKQDVPGVVRGKLVLTVIFSVLNFAFLSAHFFHTNLPMLLFDVMLIIIYIGSMLRYTTVKYIGKQLKARPDEDISYVVASLMSGAKPNRSGKPARWGIIAAGFALAAVLFATPHMMFEKSPEGCYVRFYTKGLFQNEEVITIPEEHDGEPVVGIRGDVFKNLRAVREVRMPETITTIRGYAFANCPNLEAINIPDKVTYIGGSTFKGCSALLEIELPSGITEIRGNTFEDCSSLTSVEIPYGVTRIGAHAFRQCWRLEAADLPETVEEIGSSAFRGCSSLFDIEIPSSAIVNVRAFKGSPTDIHRY